jgi:Flp pilus assembly pilin Flp
MRSIRAMVRFLADESGQALAEEGLLLVTLLGVGGVGGLILVKQHPEMLHAIDIIVRSYWFVLSLPFP